MAKPLGLPLTSAEAEAKFACSQKKKNTQTRLTFVSNLVVNFVQIIGGQTTLYKSKLKIVHHGLFNFLNDTTQEVQEFEIRYDERQFEEAYHNKLYKFLNDSSNRAFNHVIPDDTDIGFLQYLFFCEFGEIFALKWHSNYKNKSIITSKKDILEIIKFYTNNELYDTNKNEIKNLLKLNFTPTVHFNLNDCLITWYEFEEHNGIYKRTYRINRKQPYVFNLTENKKLTRISANFMY